MSEFSQKFQCSISLSDLDGVGGRPIPDKPITTEDILQHIEKNKNELPSIVDFSLKNNVATVLASDGNRYAEGTCEAKNDEFQIDLEYNFFIPQFLIKQVILESLSATRDDIFRNTYSTQTAPADYLRITNVFVNAKKFGFDLTWKLGPYKDSLKIRVSTGLTNSWYKVWDGGVDGILKVKIYARLKGTNELCVKVEAKGPFGWKEKHQACVNF